MKHWFKFVVVCLVVIVRGGVSNEEDDEVENDEEGPGIEMKCFGLFCYPELVSRQYQGDILIDDYQRNAIKVKKHLWPNGRVPYTFHSSYTAEEKKLVTDAMRFIESKTCVRFIPRFYHPQYIRITKEKKGCFAMIGFRPMHIGSLPVNLQAPECLMHTGTIQHELLHVLGLFHEQARPDRDKYVDIYWDNIDEKYFHDFDKADENEVSDFGVAYDYYSVMHYPRYAFSKNGNDTIVAKEAPKRDLGQRKGATDGDLEKVRRMYNCSSASADVVSEVLELAMLY